MIDEKRRIKILALIAVILALMGFVYASIPQDIAFEIVKNNTDLCDFNHTSGLCNGSRQNNVTYYTNDSTIILTVYAHANTAAQTAGIFAYRDDILIEAQSGRPLAVPEETWRGITLIIPRNSSYRVNVSNFHHFNWTEDQILSGRNGTLSLTQYFNTTTTGGGGVSNLSNLTIDVNKDWMGYYLTNTSTDINLRSTNIYVSKSGSDSNNGSINFPFLTITKANQYLSQYPKLTGNTEVIIDNGTWTEQITIPTLIYNGYTLKYKGKLNNVYSNTATGGAATTYGSSGNMGYIEQIGAGWTTDQYKHKLVLNPSGQWSTIHNNTATRIYYVTPSYNFATLAAGQTYTIYDWNTTINYTSGNTITLSSGSSTYLENLTINSSSTANYEGAINILSRGNLYTEKVNISGTKHGIMSLSSGFLSTSNSVYRSGLNIYFDGVSVLDGRNSNIFFTTGTTGYPNSYSIFLAAGSQGVLVSGTLLDAILGSPTFGGAKIQDKSYLYLYNSYVINSGTGVLALQFSGAYAQNTTYNTFLNNTVNKNPAAASDPSFIV